MGVKISQVKQWEFQALGEVGHSTSSLGGAGCRSG